MTALGRHTWEEHTGEVLLKVSAPTAEELFAEAGRALAELLAGKEQLTRHPAPDAGPEAVVVEASDREALLVAWLNELVWRSETHKRIYSEVAVESVDDHRLVAAVRGFEPSHIRTAVKAATLHRLRIAHDADQWHATVVLDV